MAQCIGAAGGGLNLRTLVRTREARGGCAFGGGGQAADSVAIDVRRG